MLSYKSIQNQKQEYISNLKPREGVTVGQEDNNSIYPKNIRDLQQVTQTASQGHKEKLSNTLNRHNFSNNQLIQDSKNLIKNIKKNSSALPSPIGIRNGIISLQK